jgi:hypothetical protein
LRTRGFSGNIFEVEQTIKDIEPLTIIVSSKFGRRSEKAPGLAEFWRSHRDGIESIRTLNEEQLRDVSIAE